MVDEVVDEILVGPMGRFLYTRKEEYSIRCRERPKDAGVEDGTLLCFWMQHTLPVDTTVEATMLLVDHLIHPEGQDVILQHIPHLQFQLLYFFVHFVVFFYLGRRRDEGGRRIPL